MDAKGKLELIKRNLEEMVTEKELAKLLAEKKKITAYLGYAPTGKLHIGHFVPVLKMKDLIDCGIKFKFLTADLHAHLDDLKSPWELLDARSKYYEESIKLMLKAVGGDPKKVEFVRGSSFQYKEDYVKDVLRMAALVTLNRSKRAAAEVVRFGDEPKLGGFIYPLMQSEDVIALGADIALGGIDQRGPYMFARDILPEIGHKKPVCIFSPLVAGLTGDKMSASVEKSKVEITDDEKTVENKINSSFCESGNIKENALLEMVKFIIMPVGNKFIVERDKKYGGDLKYDDYKKLEKDFADKKIHPADLKKAVAKPINKLLVTIRKNFDTKIIKKAYPND